MVKAKIVDGKIKYKLVTFDGSYVKGEMFESEARTFLSNAKENGEMPGYELESGPYRFETEEVSLTLKSRKKQEDEA